MPPKANSLDGVLKAAVDTKTAPPNAAQAAIIKEELTKEQKDQAHKSKVKAPKTSDSPTVVILITIIVMVLLIGLAYFAYNKSK